jgi:hypothetical protein
MKGSDEPFETACCMPSGSLRKDRTLEWIDRCINLRLPILYFMEADAMMRMSLKMRDGTDENYKVTDETCWAMMKDFWCGAARIYDTVENIRVEIDWRRVVQLANMRIHECPPA